MIIATHDFDFHTDDVFAIAILKLVHPDATIVRTRDPALLKKADMRVDVGRIYNPTSGGFDHHQREFTLVRNNGIPYASAGLIWKYFGMNLVHSESAFQSVDKEIIQPIDANDTGVSIYEAGIIQPYTLDDVIADFNPSWPSTDVSLYDARFSEAVTLAQSLIRFLIVKHEGLIKAQNIVRKLVKNCKSDYLVLDEYVPFKEVVTNESNLLYVLYKGEELHKWYARAVPRASGRFEVRKAFPASWGGLANEDLANVTGVEDALFCHKKLFIAVAKTKEGAIKLVELALHHEA